MDKLTYEETQFFKKMYDKKEKDVRDRAIYHRTMFKKNLGIEHVDLAETYEENLVTLQSMKKKILTQLN